MQAEGTLQIIAEVSVAFAGSTSSPTAFLAHLYWLVLGMAAMFVTAVAPLWQRRA